MNLTKPFIAPVCIGFVWTATISCNDPDSEAPQPKPPSSSARAAARVSDTAFSAHILRIRIASDRYRSLNGTYPSEVSELVSAGLLHPGQELDPWDHPYALRAEGGSLIVTSYGADGEPGGTGPAQDRVSPGGPDLR